MKAEGTADIENILAHAGWLRRFALALVKNPEEAEDLTQETILAGWQHPVERMERAWLARVARNLMLNRVRSSRRRDLREQAAESLRPQLASTPETLIADAEIHRTVAHVVTNLAEPFRETLVLRFYEGLSSADIARRLGVPDGTIRWRLKEGLARVRRELDARHGNDRSAWMALLAPLVPPSIPARATPKVRPISRNHELTAGTRIALALIGGSLLVLVTLGFLARAGRESPSPMVRDLAAPSVETARPLPRHAVIPKFVDPQFATAEEPAPPGPGPSDAQSLAEELLQAVRSNDYDGFVAKGAAFFRAALPTGVFAGLNEKLGPLLEPGFRVLTLGSVRRSGSIDWLFTIEFANGNDDALLTLAIDGWQVAGFYIHDPNALLGEETP